MGGRTDQIRENLGERIFADALVQCEQERAVRVTPGFPAWETWRKNADTDLIFLH